MAKPTKNLGRPVSVHGVSPAYMQRAAIIAVLSFIFFLVMLVIFSFRRQMGYFILASAFLAVEIFTLLGLYSSRKNVLKTFERGFQYKKEQVLWNEIESVNDGPDGAGLEVIRKDADKIVLPGALYDLEIARTIITRGIAAH